MTHKPTKSVLSTLALLAVSAIALTGCSAASTSVTEQTTSTPVSSNAQLVAAQTSDRFVDVFLDGTAEGTYLPADFDFYVCVDTDNGVSSGKYIAVEAEDGISVRSGQLTYGDDLQGLTGSDYCARLDEGTYFNSMGAAFDRNNYDGRVVLINGENGSSLESFGWYEDEGVSENGIVLDSLETYIVSAD